MTRFPPGREKPSARSPACDEFKESDHPRADNGQFGSSGIVHVVATTDDTGPDIRHVTDDGDAADKHRDQIEQDEDDDSAEVHAVPFERRNDGPVDAVHIVHSGGGDVFGVELHSAHDEYGAARGAALLRSKEAWDDYGPNRGDIDRLEEEEDEAAQSWNDDHANDKDAILVKTDESGFVDRDLNGALQWTQGGEDVEPGDDFLDEFSAHFDGMFPSDERPSYPGLNAANDHFESVGEQENMFRVHSHKVK